MRSTFRRWLAASFLVPLGLVFTAGQAFAYSYNGGAAASYADTYWSNYNPNYPSFTDDCTNFVSQSLYAGGLPQYIYYNLHTGAPETTSDNYTGSWIRAILTTPIPGRWLLISMRI